MAQRHSGSSQTAAAAPVVHAWDCSLPMMRKFPPELDQAPPVVPTPGHHPAATAKDVPGAATEAAAAHAAAAAQPGGSPQHTQANTDPAARPAGAKADVADACEACMRKQASPQPHEGAAQAQQQAQTQAQGQIGEQKAPAATGRIPAASPPLTQSLHSLQRSSAALAAYAGVSKMAKMRAQRRPGEGRGRASGAAIPRSPSVAMGAARVLSLIHI